MKRKRTIGILFAAAIILSVFITVPATDVLAASDDYYASNQIAVTAPDVPDEENAYIVFSGEPKKNKMYYYGSEEEGRYTELYSEAVEWNGVPARQVYVENYFYLKFDESFADENDTVFRIDIDYWDYGGGGYFYVEYKPQGSADTKTEQVYKLGLDENGVKTAGTWFRVTIYLDDAEFTGKFSNGADIRIRSGAYNSFSKIEVRNISRTAKPNENFGTFNLSKAQSLHNLGAFDGYGTGEEFEPCLDKELTREEALVQLIKSYRMEDDALAQNRKSGFSDVSSEAEPYVAHALELGIIDGGSTLGAKETFSQKELIVWYLKLIGIEDENLWENAYRLAQEAELISEGCMLFQPERTVNVDALVLLAMNSFSITNSKTGYCPFTDGMESGDYDMQTLTQSSDDKIWNWLMNSEFKLPKTTHKDPYTGREYYTVDFFGQHAIKPYFTMNCMSIDETRIYFRTKDFKIWEYNIETQMCRYIDDTPNENNCMVTSQNNLWYVNAQFEIWKLDLNNYEKEFIGSLPEWQKGVPSLLQVNNDESKLSIWWPTDTSGDFDTTMNMRLPVFDIKTGEWDLSHWYGFDYPDYAPNHPCLNPNPLYDHLYFFAHETNSQTRTYFYEGSTMPERVWMANFETGEYYNAVNQRWFRAPDPDKPGSGYVGETAGHEIWSPDGEWLLAVRQEQSLDNMRVTIGPEAYFRMQRYDGTDTRYIWVDYSKTVAIIGSGGSGTNHSMLSNDNRWLTGDTNYYGGKWSGLYVFDTETGATTLCAILPESGSNPGHVHPQFSATNKYVIFGCWDEKYKTARFGWMDVSDITSNPAPGGRYDISKTCDAIDYDGDFDFDVEPLYDGDGTYQGTKVPAGKELYVNVKREVVDADNVSAEISITYKDDTTLPINFTTHRWVENSHKYVNYLTNDTLYIDRTNTGKILTKTFTFDDINLCNMDLYGTDFRIGAVGSAATIISVDVKVTQGKDEEK